MRKIQYFRFLTIIGCLFFMEEAQAQFSMIYSMGISPQQTPNGHYLIVNRSAPRDEFTFDLAQVKASYFIGAGTRYSLKPFFLMAEAQYNKREYVYSIVPTYPTFVRSDETIQFTETMHVINVPVSVGVDLGFMEVYSGFLPQIIVSQQTNMDELSGYEQKLNPLRFGWHTGIAAKVANLRIGLNWQMDANGYADHIYINDQNLRLNGNSSRLVGLLSYAF
jgi:hypothetical protein